MLRGLVLVPSEQGVLRRHPATYGDYSDIFDDAKISIDLGRPYAKRQLAPQQILRSEAQKVWQEFRKLPDGARY